MTEILRPKALNPAATRPTKYLVFKLGVTSYAFRLSAVREVTELRPIAPIPNAPPYILGLINLRGKVITALDLAKKLSLPITPDASRPSVLIVAESQTESFACLVHVLSEVLAISEQQVDRLVDSTHSLHNFLEGIARFHDREMILLLNTDKILSLNTNTTIDALTA